MTTFEKLVVARDLMKQAESILNEIEINPENTSLIKKYGSSIHVIKQQLNMFSDNTNRYVTGDTNLEEIIENESINWNDTSVCDGSGIHDYIDNISIY
jgi:nitrogenase molybdenum-iron protein alpha/beta subunit